MVAQGDLWLLELPDEKRRPVLVVTRDSVLPVISIVLVAPVTSTLRGLPSCVPLDATHGLDHDSEATFDSLRPVPKSLLTVRLGELGPDARTIICGAMEAVADC